MKKYTLLFILAWCYIASNAQWINQVSPLASGCRFNKIQFTNSTTGYALAEGYFIADGYMLKTTDGGNTWNQLTGITNSVQKLDCEFFETGLGIVCTNYTGKLHRTTDGGNTFTQITPKSNGQGLFSSISFITPKYGFIVDDDAYEIYRTSDSGKTWVKKGNLPVNANMSEIQFFDTLTGYLRKSGFYKTTDGGATWTALSIPFPGTSTAPGVYYFINKNEGWITGGGAILKTIDGGQTWTTLSTGLTGILRGIHFINSTQGYVVGNNGTANPILLKTINGGNTWTTETSPNSSTLSCVRMVSPTQVYVGGHDNTIIVNNTGFPLNITETNKEKSFRVYPNPTNSNISIAPVSSNSIRVGITDMMGRIIFNETGTIAQINSSLLDKNPLVQGIYTITIQDMQTSQMQSELVIKK